MDIKTVFSRLTNGVVNGNTTVKEAALNLDAALTKSALEENPDAMTFCCRCGCEVRISETDEYGNCC